MYLNVCHGELIFSNFLTSHTGDITCPLGTTSCLHPDLPDFSIF